MRKSIDLNARTRELAAERGISFGKARAELGRRGGRTIARKAEARRLRAQLEERRGLV